MWLWSLSILAENQNAQIWYFNICSTCDERRNSSNIRAFFAYDLCRLCWCVNLSFGNWDYCLDLCLFFGWILKNITAGHARNPSVSNSVTFFAFVSVITCFCSRRVDGVQIVSVKFKMIAHCQRDAVDEKCYKVPFKNIGQQLWTVVESQ